jgi:protein SCO1/2
MFRRFAGVMLLLLVTNVATACQPYQYHGAQVEPPLPVTDFSLPAMDGTEFRLSDYQGQIVLLYFGYTSCPDVCPATLYQVKRAIETLGERATGVQVVMVTVDPQRDTPERLTAYLNNINPAFIGLRTTDLVQLDEVMAQFGAYYEIDADTSGSAAGYTISHTASVFVIGRDMSLRLIFPFGTSGEDMAQDLTHLLRER